MSQDAGTPAFAKPKSLRFRKARPRMAADAARRQGNITTLAFVHLGSRDAAIAFLNSPHAELAARPIDLATDSPEGFARVERVVLRAALQ